MNQLNKIT